ncbi:MAG TPA: four helix bundle protein [Bacteroidia bacterium]|nr:four helix bundle protein [Bacteroidia bacterium]
MKDRLDEVIFYQKSLQFWDNFWNDSEYLLKDIRGKEIAKQLTRSAGSVSANIEEGYGRGYGKEYPHFLRIARGSARETRGWYKRAKFLLPEKTVSIRDEELGEIIAMLSKSISTLENKK